MKKFLSMLLAMLMVLSLAACGAKAPAADAPAADAPAADAPAAESETIKVGYISDLTGETKLWGQAGLNGMLLAAEDINAAGGILGKQVEVVAMDGKGVPDDSVSAYKKLVDEGVVASVGTNFSSCNTPMAFVADELHVPIVGTAPSAEKVTVDPETGKLHEYSFRMCFIDPFQGKAMGAYATKTLGFTKAAVLSNIDDDYSTGVSNAFIEAFEANGGTVVAHEKCTNADTDFRAQLAKIAASEPDCVLVPLIYQNVALAAKQAREMGITATFLGTDGWDSSELAGLADGALEGGYYISRIAFNLPAAKEFGERYLEVYGTENGLENECLFGYDGLMWVKQAIEAAGSTDPVAIRDALEATETFEGLIGTLAMNPENHNPDMDCAAFTCKDGVVTYVETIPFETVR